MAKTPLRQAAVASTLQLWHFPPGLTPSSTAAGPRGVNRASHSCPTRFPAIPTKRTGTVRHDFRSLPHHCLRSPLHRLRHRHGQGRARGRSRHRPHAGNRGRHPGRRARLSRPAILDRRRRRRGHLPLARLPARPHPGGRLRRGRGALGCCRLYRHERLGPRQCQDRASRDQEPGRGPEPRLPRRRHHRHARRGLSPPRRVGLFPRAHPDAAIEPGLARGGGCAGLLGLRSIADLHLRPSWRRYLHQGRRCWR